MVKNLNKQASKQSADFEQAFFQLAYERLSEKLQNLIPYLVGFEIVEKSDDNNKALGVFGFKSDNGQTLFVPAFFYNGEVKGVNILYSANSEQFFPLNEDFAELFLKDDVTGLGKPSAQKSEKIKQEVIRPDMKMFVRPPRTAKVSYASVIDYLGESNNKTKEAFVHLMEKNAKFLEAVTTFYSLEDLSKVLVPKQAEEEKKHKKSTIKVYRSEDDLSELTPDQKHEVIQNGFIIVDERGEQDKSKFGLTEYTKKFTNPSDSGIYNYVTASGSLQPALIFTKPFSFSKGLGRHSDHSLVVSLEDGSEAPTYHEATNNIFVREKVVVKDLPSVLKGLQDPAEAKPSFSDLYILVNESLTSTLPFNIAANFKDSTGLRRIQIDPHYIFHKEDKPPFNSYEISRTGRDRGVGYAVNRSLFLVFTKKVGDKLSFDKNTIFVPKGFKLLRIKFGSNYPIGGVCEQDSCSPISDELKKKYEAEEKKRKLLNERYQNFRPGRLTSLFGSMAEQYIYPMAVTSNGSEYFTSVAGIKKKHDNAVETKIALVTTYGLDPKQAEEIVNSTAYDKPVKGTIKLAYLGDQTLSLQDPTPYANHLGQPTYDGVGHTQTLPPDQVYTDNPTATGRGTATFAEGNDVSSNIDNAYQLAQNGQKEIFDTQTIATLAKYVNPESKITSYMPDFLSCIDKLGRLLYLVYWETQKFSEMFGRGELTDLVELLNDVFENLGELVIFLKKKSPQLSINMSEKEIEA